MFTRCIHCGWVGDLRGLTCISCFQLPVQTVIAMQGEVLATGLSPMLLYGDGHGRVITMDHYAA